MTNAGRNASGQYPCSGPPDSSGFYKCAGSDDRFYRYSLTGVWTRVAFKSPGTNNSEVLTFGDPSASISPALIDSEAFEGNMSSFSPWHYSTRTYNYIP